MHINDLLKMASERKASDLHLKVGSHPVLRINGELIPLVETKRVPVLARVAPLGHWIEADVRHFIWQLRVESSPQMLAVALGGDTSGEGAGVLRVAHLAPARGCRARELGRDVIEACLGYAEK